MLDVMQLSENSCLVDQSVGAHKKSKSSKPHGLSWEDLVKEILDTVFIIPIMHSISCIQQLFNNS